MTAARACEKALTTRSRQLPDKACVGRDLGCGLSDDSVQSRLGVLTRVCIASAAWLQHDSGGLEALAQGILGCGGAIDLADDRTLQRSGGQPVEFAFATAAAAASAGASAARAAFPDRYFLGGAPSVFSYDGSTHYHCNPCVGGSSATREPHSFIIGSLIGNRLPTLLLTLLGSAAAEMAWPRMSWSHRSCVHTALVCAHPTVLDTVRSSFFKLPMLVTVCFKASARTSRLAQATHTGSACGHFPEPFKLTSHQGIRQFASVPNLNPQSDTLA